MEGSSHSVKNRGGTDLNNPPPFFKLAELLKELNFTKSGKTHYLRLPHGLISIEIQGNFVKAIWEQPNLAKDIIFFEYPQTISYEFPLWLEFYMKQGYISEKGTIGFIMP